MERNIEKQARITKEAVVKQFDLGSLSSEVKRKPSFKIPVCLFCFCVSSTATQKIRLLCNNDSKRCHKLIRVEQVYRSFMSFFGLVEIVEGRFNEVLQRAAHLEVSFRAYICLRICIRPTRRTHQLTSLPASPFSTPFYTSANTQISHRIASRQYRFPLKYR